jgi:2-keto-4-pentenoate hydratase/2-oxohepta-3-ene-1,7-dioic acid hydratase in catechol pathway
MKLVTYIRDRKPRLGLKLDDRLLDLADANQAFISSLPEDEHKHTGFKLPTDMLTFLQAGDEALQTTLAIVDWYQKEQDNLAGALDTLEFSATKITAPLTNPGKIIAVGLNYLDHCREQNIEIPKKPILFAKYPSAIIGPGDSITWPADLTEQVDYEAELAVIIGQQAYQVPAERADQFIAGYTIVNDVSARDLQFGDGQWVRGKSLDTFCPMGPALVTRDEITDPQNLDISCWVNESLMQKSNTSLMIFNIQDLIEFITQGITLNPGDVICTGTPHGVGAFRKPPVFLKPKDVLKVSIEALGELENPVS